MMSIPEMRTSHGEHDFRNTMMTLADARMWAVEHMQGLNRCQLLALFSFDDDALEALKEAIEEACYPEPTVEHDDGHCEVLRETLFGDASELFMREAWAAVVNFVADFQGWEPLEQSGGQCLECECECHEFAPPSNASDLN